MREFSRSGGAARCLRLPCPYRTTTLQVPSSIGSPTRHSVFDEAGIKGETPVPRSGAEERRGAKAVIDAQVRPPVQQVRPPVQKKAARRDQAAKRSTNDALRAVRKFGGTLHDIPVSAYAPDGKQRTIVIRPTSVQDVYYYSVPR